MKSQQQQSVLKEEIANNKEQVTRLTAEKADALQQATDLKQSLKEAQVHLLLMCCCARSAVFSVHSQLSLLCMPDDPCCGCSAVPALHAW